MVLRYGQGIKLYTAHEHWLICPTHVLFKFNREPCVSRSCVRCQLAHRRPPQLWRYSGLLKKALRHVDAFIAVSEFTRRRHLDAGLDLPMVHIPCCLGEASEAAAGERGLEAIPLPARPFFLFVGRLEKLKGLQTILPLFRSYPGADLVIAGDGDYAAELKKLAAGCERIHFLGRLSQPQLKAAYARAIALLVPSIAYETFGQVIIEAYAQRTPVIVRDLGPLPEIVAQSGGGLVFGNETDLLAAMERLRGDRAFRDRLGAAGHEAYRSRWTEEVHLEQYLGLIEELRQRKGGSGLWGAPPRSGGPGSGLNGAGSRHA
jgi:glycosyltransferase involved in cell wall biosynthesis